MNRSVLFLLTLLPHILTASYTVNAQDNKPIVLYANDKVDMLTFYSAPIKFTQSGVRCYFTHTFNKKEYLEYLPNNFTHVVQFIKYGLDTDQSFSFYLSVLKLFHQKLKGAPYINAYAFSQMLDELSSPLEALLHEEPVNLFALFKNKLRQIFFSSFANKFSSFQDDPAAFLDELSDEIIQAFKENDAFTEENTTRTQLRNMVVRFLENTTARLVWSPKDQDEIWTNIKTIAHQFERLHTVGVISDASDLDDLYWSLIHRFCLFLELTGSHLPQALYEKIKNEIMGGSLPFIMHSEQEELITPKAAHLLDAIYGAEVKGIAREHGIIAEAIV